ncbi:MAG: hypothetical protein OEY40_03240 [Candidatus Bathyarchaeota archaeon]|nr:hypothetical protein [Candidatus Bathyarchaeota archaeon]
MKGKVLLLMLLLGLFTQIEIIKGVSKLYEWEVQAGCSKYQVPNSQLASSQHSAIGAQTTIVILVEFLDAMHSVSRDEIHRRVFTDMDTYYQEISYNLTWVTGETVSRWYSLSANFSSYNITWWDSPYDEYKRIITNATSLVDEAVDFRKYEHLLIVSARNSTSKVWAHQLSGLSIETNDGVTVDKAIVVSEDDSTGT